MHLVYICRMIYVYIYHDIYRIHIIHMNNIYIGLHTCIMSCINRIHIIHMNDLYEQDLLFNAQACQAHKLAAAVCFALTPCMYVWATLYKTKINKLLFLSLSLLLSLSLSPSLPLSLFSLSAVATNYNSPPTVRIDICGTS